MIRESPSLVCLARHRWAIRIATVGSVATGLAISRDEPDGDNCRNGSGGGRLALLKSLVLTVIVGGMGDVTKEERRGEGFT